MRRGKWLVWALLVFISLVLESSLFVHLTLFGAKPDLLLIYVVLIGMLQGRQEGAKKGFIIGLAEDIFLGRLIGSNALTKAVMGFFSGQVEEEIIKENPIIALFLVWVFSLVHHLFYGLLLILMGQGSSLGLDFLGTMLTFAVYNALLTLPIFPVFYRLLVKGPLE